MKKKALYAMAAAGFLAAPVQAAQFVEGNYVACLTEEKLDQFINASIDKDMNAINYLFENGCIRPRAGIEVSVLDRTWTGTVHVRAYADGNTVELWTVMEAISD